MQPNLRQRVYEAWFGMIASPASKEPEAIESSLNHHIKSFLCSGPKPVCYAKRQIDAAGTRRRAGNFSCARI